MAQSHRERWNELRSYRELQAKVDNAIVGRGPPLEAYEIIEYDRLSSRIQLSGIVRKINEEYSQRVRELRERHEAAHIPIPLSSLIFID